MGVQIRQGLGLGDREVSRERERKSWGGRNMVGMLLERERENICLRNHIK